MSLCKILWISDKSLHIFELKWNWSCGDIPRILLSPLFCTLHDLLSSSSLRESRGIITKVEKATKSRTIITSHSRKWSLGLFSWQWSREELGNPVNYAKACFRHKRNIRGGKREFLTKILRHKNHFSFLLIIWLEWMAFWLKISIKKKQ